MARAAKLFVFLFIFLSLSLSLFDSYVLALEGESIIGGDYAAENQFKYVVSIQAHGEGHICGGGIIGDQFILTAAHCVIDEKGEFYRQPYRVVAGSVDLRYPADVEIAVSKAYVPRDYQPSAFGFDDIAVLKLKKPLGLSNNPELSKLELPLSAIDHTDYVGETTVLAGYGYNSMKTKFFNMIETDGDSDWKLKFANVSIVGKEECELSFLWILKKKIDDDKQICGRLFQRDPQDPEGLCSGDSGSPLVIANTVIGVVSNSPIGCTENKKGAVYTRVSFFLSFIKQAIKGHRSKQIRAFRFPQVYPFSVNI